MHLFPLEKKMRSVFSLCCSSSLHVCQWDLCLYSMCFSKQNDHFSPRPILQFPSLKKWWMRKFGSLNVLSRLIYFWNSLVNLQVFLCVLKFWCVFEVFIMIMNQLRGIFLGIWLLIIHLYWGNMPCWFGQFLSQHNLLVKESVLLRFKNVWMALIRHFLLFSWKAVC